MARKSNNLTIRFTGLVCFCVLVMGGYATLSFFSRSNLKKQCSSGMDCFCFSNIVDNRLSKKQIRGFTKFLGEIKKRSSANILEFMDEDDARALSKVISLCRLDKPVNHGSENQDVVDSNKNNIK